MRMIAVETLQQYHIQPTDLTRGAVLDYIRKELSKWDWSKCQSRHYENGRWITMSFGRIDFESPDHEGVDLKNYVQLTTLTLCVTIPDCDIPLKATAVFRIDGTFLGFTRDSIYSVTLSEFCVQLFRKGK